MQAFSRAVRARSFVLAAVCAASLGIASSAVAGSVGAAEREFAAEVAAAGGPPATAVLATLAQARVQQSILDAMARPAEKTRSWKDYRPIFLTTARIEDGIGFYRENRALLDRVAGEYGVPPQIIVAIIGVETSYGRITGKYRVLDALVTLAFHYPPRASYFRGELKRLFLLGDQHLAYPLEDLRGSYAGAMGWGQFMPTSIAEWARDADGDGRIDLWNSLPDITASVANYFKAHGWQAGQPVTVRASAASDAHALEPGGLEPVYTVQQLEAWGYAPLERSDAALPATLLKLDGEAGLEHWLTFRNFYVITRYNRSPLYAMAVWQLADEIAAGMDAGRP
ncbi:lytic murein transglycosylase B [Dokdonella sp.]|uniref:lytic murein transglycosylase B n=1 Tax=Dokdonella sp. TaxID=2291710 RepID=UPI0031C6C685|nr:lytic murein transglycosylase B [Dokdonella sp.]